MSLLHRKQTIFQSLLNFLYLTLTSILNFFNPKKNLTLTLPLSRSHSESDLPSWTTEDHLTPRAPLLDKSNPKFIFFE